MSEADPARPYGRPEMAQTPSREPADLLRALADDPWAQPSPPARPRPARPLPRLRLAADPEPEPARPSLRRAGDVPPVTLAAPSSRSRTLLALALLAAVGVGSAGARLLQHDGERLRAPLAAPSAEAILSAPQEETTPAPSAGERGAVGTETTGKAPRPGAPQRRPRVSLPDWDDVFGAPASRRPRSAPSAVTDYGLADAVPVSPSSEGSGPPAREETSSAVASTEPPPPPTGEELLAASRVLSAEIEEVGPFAARISWTTDRRVPGRLSYGVGGAYFTLQRAEPATRHSFLLEGLIPERSYEVVVSASREGSGGRRLTFRTPPVNETPRAAIKGAALTLDGYPFFPIFAYGYCASDVWQLARAGVNVFMPGPEGCQGEKDPAGVEPLPAKLQHRAFFVVAYGSKRVPGQIGWFQPDEADGRRMFASDLPAIPPSSQTGLISVMTLTHHYIPWAARLSWFPLEAYPALAERAEVLATNIYPLANLCNRKKLVYVVDGQLELVRLAKGRPTFQWIEMRQMDCKGDTSHLQVTPEIVRMELWASLVGGATGVGLFPNDFGEPVERQAAEETNLMRELTPYTTAANEPLSVRASGPFVRASMRRFGSQRLVMAVNASDEAAGEVRILVPELAKGETVRELRSSRTLRSEEGALVTRLAPHEVGLFLLPPSPFS
jgi:hypothetical protein